MASTSEASGREDRSSGFLAFKPQTSMGNKIPAGKSSSGLGLKVELAQPPGRSSVEDKSVNDMASTSEASGREDGRSGFLSSKPQTSMGNKNKGKKSKVPPEKEEYSSSNSSDSESSEDSDLLSDDDLMKGEKVNVREKERYAEYETMMNTNGVKKYECPECGKKYQDVRKFREHIDAHKYGKRFKCETCGKLFSNKSNLKSHLDVHIQTRQSVCDVCGKTFKTNNHLVAHKRTHGERKIVCEVCGKKFITAGHLKRHQEISHNKEKIHPCEHCGKLFANVMYLKRHIILHSKKKEKRHSCSECDFKSYSPANVRMHYMRVHSGERPFKCTLCEKGFVSKVSLETHMNTHTREKNYKCDICEAVFTNMSSLDRHKKSHSGRKDYKCDICGKDYTQSHNLKNHKKKHERASMKAYGGDVYVLSCFNVLFGAQEVTMEDDKRFTVCRLCLCPSDSLINICEYYDGYTPADVISELLEFEIVNQIPKVSTGDIYPQCVCEICMRKLKDFKVFKELCKVFKASIDRAYAARRVCPPESTPIVADLSPVPCNIEKILPIEVSEEAKADHGELIVPDDPMDFPMSMKNCTVKSLNISCVNDKQIIALNRNPHPGEVSEEIKTERGEVIVPDDPMDIPMSMKNCSVRLLNISCVNDKQIIALDMNPHPEELHGDNAATEEIKEKFSCDDNGVCVKEEDDSSSEDYSTMDEEGDTCRADEENVENGKQIHKGEQLPVKTHVVLQGNSVDTRVLNQARRNVDASPTSKTTEIKEALSPKARDSGGGAPRTRQRLTRSMAAAAGKQSKGKEKKPLYCADPDDDSDSNHFLDDLEDDSSSNSSIEMNSSESNSDDEFQPPSAKKIKEPHLSSALSTLAECVSEKELEDPSSKEDKDSVDLKRSYEICQAALMRCPEPRKLKDKLIPPPPSLLGAQQSNDPVTLSKYVSPAGKSSSGSVLKRILTQPAGRSSVGDKSVNHMASTSEVSGREDRSSGFLASKPQTSMGNKNKAKRSEVPSIKGEYSSSSSSDSEDSDLYSDDDVTKEEEDPFGLKNNLDSSLMMDIDGVKKYKCPECGKRYLDFRKFRYHVDAHKYGKRFKCETCGKLFASKNYLKTHLAVHVQTRQSVCDICGKTFKTNDHLVSHKRTHGERKIVCEVCGKKFITAGHLKRHQEISHNKEKIHPCEHCGKLFANVMYLKRHIILHSKKKEKRHSCSECDFKSYTPANIRVHYMRVHSGERPFKCTLCEKGFVSKGSLETHMNTHTREKNYKCDICEAVFTNMSSLDRHKKSHSGRKDYKCDICGKDYTQSHNLKNHKKKHERASRK
ncbi:zinc finger protein 91-like [Hetaerina americana]|uniref:zinc finger protein 91-like n=1 Tax=Hetaerina americana TaxID=62018 RepID=UPI003A7F5DD9